MRKVLKYKNYEIITLTEIVPDNFSVKIVTKAYDLLDFDKPIFQNSFMFGFNDLFNKGRQNIEEIIKGQQVEAEIKIDNIIKCEEFFNELGFKK